MPRLLDRLGKAGGAMFDPSIVAPPVVDEVQQQPGKHRKHRCRAEVSDEGRLCRTSLCVAGR